MPVPAWVLAWIQQKDEALLYDPDSLSVCPDVPPVPLGVEGGEALARVLLAQRRALWAGILGTGEGEPPILYSARMEALNHAADAEEARPRAHG